jgi:LacI family transcriptional regulator
MTRINQAALARHLNLSQTTVSRSLANHPAINPETKALVLQAAAKLGYHQPLKRTPAQKNPKGSTGVLGIVISVNREKSGPSESFQGVLTGIADQAASLDAILDVVYHDPANKTDRELTKRMRSSDWQGAILIYPLHEDLASSISSRIPCVSLIETYSGLLIDSIDINQHAAYREIVSHLIGLGHRRIAFFTWRYSVEAPWVFHRFGNYVEALYRSGIAFDPDWAINLLPGEDDTVKELIDGVVRRIESGVTAIVCAADHQAYHLIKDLKDRGIQVPEDVSITGFDGIPAWPGLPPLTTVSLPYRQLGRSACQLLHRRMEHPGLPQRHLIIEGQFHEGATVAQPPIS